MNPKYKDMTADELYQDTDLEAASQELRESMERLKEKLGADMTPLAYTQWALNQIDDLPEGCFVIIPSETWGQAN